MDKKSIIRNQVQGQNRKDNHMDIAIIGIGLKIADENSLQEYWRIFENNIDCIREIPEHRKNQIREYTKVYLGEGLEPEYYKGTYLEHLDEFDYEYFKISPREAQVMDPAQRLLLETICETFDDAGYSAKALKGSKTGVFIGYSAGSFKDNYLVDISFKHPDLIKYAMVGNMPSILPARASHILDLKGPSLVLDTACSSSLVAINQACDSLKSRTSEMAIAGGVKLNLLPLITQDTKLGFESDDDKTRTFDASASGTSIGEGVACILLKPLEQAVKDKDYIYAVIKGISVNHDGTAMGITAPNPVAQTNVILDALNDADIHPEDIDYIETHGTATILGDPIEFQGLNNAFGMYTQRKQYCALSASKSNLGHLYECASMAATIKAVAAIKYKKIPGMKNFMQPNMIIGFCNSPFYVNQYTKDWEVPKGKLRTCAVSAFGISGTNCHMILQEYPEKVNKEENRPVDILCLSAKCQESLLVLIDRFVELLSDTSTDINLITLNANKNKMHYQFRLAVVFESRQELMDKLRCTLNADGLKSQHSEGIYYADLKKQASVALTGTVCEDILQDSNEMLLEYPETEDRLSAKLDIKRMFDNIARMYTDGSDIDWEILYKGFRQDKVILPHYPFKKSHVWLPVEKLVKQEINASKESSVQKNDINDDAIGHKEQLYYKRIFLKKDRSNETCHLKDCLLIQLSDNIRQDIHKCLENKFRRIITISIDEKMLDIINAENYFLKLYKSVDFSEITHIIYTGNIYKEPVQSDVALSQYQRTALLSLSSLYKCLKSSIWSKNYFTIISLVNSAFCVTGEEVCLRPEGAAIFGFGKALNREFKNIHTYCIDFDEDTKLQIIADEMEVGHGLDIVCFRNDVRYVEGLKEVEIPAAGKDVSVKDGHIYLITGGVGGIGYETAMGILGRAEDITLVLLGRIALPEASQWEAILRENKDQQIVRRIKRLHELQKYAKHVAYYSCDISDKAAVEFVINSVNQQYGRINGVFHAAGIGGGTNLAGLTENRIMGMIAPKIFGTYIIDHATRNQELDFFVMYSSISTIFSSSDLPDYAAGNVYMDAYSAYRRKSEPGASVTINWATWSETGMSVDHNFTMDTLFKAIKTKTGITGLFSVLKNGSGNIVIGELNLNSQMGLLIKKYPMEFSPYIKDKIRVLEEAQKKIQEEAKKSAPATGEYGRVESQLCEACCKVLGYDVISLYDNFFELGADSIMLGYIFNEVDLLYPNLLKITDLFSNPTVKSLAEYIIELGGIIPEDTESEEETFLEMEMTEEEQQESIRKQEENAIDDKDIAIIGVGMKLPNADNLEEYWEILINGINVIRDMPEEHKSEVENHIRYQYKTNDEVKFRKCAYLDEINKFDYAYFGISPREASLIDPANRLFLECCATAIDDAGYGKNGIRGTNTGIFLGYSANIGSAYSRLLYEADPELFNASLPLNQISMSASKVAYLYDLKGPSMVIDTACSSSLVSVHMACDQIRNGSCDMALAGGVSLALSPVADKFSIGFESKEEKTRAFGDNSTGSAVGEGVGVVLLKSMKQAVRDGDAIYAVIKGSAINQDGSSFGIAAPNYLAQSEVIQRAWKNAKVTPYDISYIEAHGTGTPLGDSIEIRGITHAYEIVTMDRQICGIGSLKTNIGHLNEASGISGLLKMILMLRYKTIPPSLNLNVPNRNIEFLESPLYVITRPTPLLPKKKRALIGINSFGMSGTNCHLIMEEAPEINNASKVESYDTHVFTSTAKSTNALKNLLKRYLEYFNCQDTIELRDICHTLNVGRYHFPYRVAFTFQNRQELIYKLEQLSSSYPYDASISDSFMGQYAIVPENKTNRYDYEITLKEQNKLTAKAEMLIKEYMSSGLQNLLPGILECYVKGAEIAWESMYNGVCNKMHLPTYPYDKLHCWYKVPELELIQEEVKLDSYYYEKNWVNDEAEDLSGLKAADTVVIVHDNKLRLKELTQLLEQEGIDVIHLYTGVDFKKEDDNHYIVPSATDCYQAFFEDILHRNIKMILHARSLCNAPSESRDEIELKMETGFFDLIYIIKAMSKAHFNQKIDLIILSCNAYNINGNEKYLIPENAAVLSLGKVIEQEYSNINCRAIDMELDTLAECICKEIHVNTYLYMTGYRNNLRYVEEMDEADIDQSDVDVLREDGVYVITGGTDGIGLETAIYISRQITGHIILLSRKGFAAEEEWEELKKDKKLNHKIEMFEEIKDNGCILRIYSCDVGDYNCVKEVLEDVRKQCGRINAVIHSAGISGAGYILRKEKESFLSVFNPKIYGAWNLDILTIQDNLDFMLNYSSAVTDSGEAGQSDYVAANSYLDAFTDYRNRLGRKTLTVNWVSWKETGMSVKHGINVDSATKAITTKEGIYALDYFIRSSKHRVMIGQFNVNDNFLTMSQYSKNKASKRITAKIAALIEVSQSSQEDQRLSDGNRDFAQIRNGKLIFIPKSDKVLKAKSAYTNTQLIGDYTNQYSETEKVIGSIYSSILGYEEINVFDNFFEMGGDSVMLSEMHGLIDERYPEYLTIADLFEYTSVRNLAEYINSKKLQTESTGAEEEAALTVDAKQKDQLCVYNISEAQKRIYFDSRLNANKLMYNNPFVSDISEFEGDLEEIISKIIQRHEILRTYFVLIDSKLMQYVLPELKIKIDYIQVIDIEKIDYHSYLRSFDYKQAPLFHVTVFLGPEQEKILLFDVHHILLDGYSVSMLQEEMLALALGKHLEEPKGQYHEYIEFETEFMQMDEYRKMEKYWAKRLENYDDTLELPTISKEVSYAFVEETIDIELAERMKTLSKSMNISLFSVFYTALSMAISKESGKKDIVLLVPTLNRYRPRFRKILGVFINLIPMRSYVDDDRNIFDHLMLTAKNIEQDIRNQFYDYNNIVKLKKAANNNQLPKFYYFFDFEDQSIKKIKDKKEIAINMKIPKNNIDFNIKKYNQVFTLHVSYKANIYRKEQIDNIIHGFKEMLACFLQTD